MLLIECRDALPAITLDRARLYRVKLDLDQRIKTVLEPWEVKPDEVIPEGAVII